MSTSDPIVIVGAKRTPQGRFLGKLAGLSALDLAITAGKAALGEISPSAIDLTIVGNVLPPVINVSRQMALHLGIPDSAVSYTVNMVCASGLKAIALAADAIRLGDAEVALCGGTESMSNAPHFLQGGRNGSLRLGDGTLVDSLLMGLCDPVIKETMAHTGQRLAERFEITREQQDLFAYQGHQKAIAAQANGIYADELVSMPELEQDEHPRADTTIERLAKLRPTLGAGTTITAGNASGINDGAAMMVICKLSTAEKNGWKPLARISSTVSAGCDPKVMGEGPVHAIRKLLCKENTTLDSFDAIEINEAFAAQALSCLKQLNIAFDDSRFNRYGSGVALGHPLGASGARIATHLAHRIARGETKRSIASLCVGGGMGIASIIEAV